MNALTLSAIAAGGALGAVARHLVHRSLTALHGAEAAWSTLGVNVAGSLLLGLAAGFLAERDGAFAAFVMTGLLGAFTTFSTFALDAEALFSERGLMIAGLYVALSVVIAIVAFVIGLGAGRSLV